MRYVLTRYAGDDESPSGSIEEMSVNYAKKNFAYTIPYTFQQRKVKQVIEFLTAHPNTIFADEDIFEYVVKDNTGHQITWDGNVDTFTKMFEFQRADDLGDNRILVLSRMTFMGKHKVLFSSRVLPESYNAYCRKLFIDSFIDTL